MRKCHPKNERIKRHYFAYLEEAKRMNSSSVDQAAAAIANFENTTGHRDFAAFHTEQARKFKRHLAEEINSTTGKPLAKATTYSRLMAVKSFLVWLAGQPGYRSCLTYSDMEYFNPSNNDGRIAKATHEKPVPTLAEIRHVLNSMPASTDIEKRDRAIIAFAILSGARDDAIASVSIRHVDISHRTVFQDGRDVRTKNRKTFTSSFFPVGSDIETIVENWHSFLIRERLYGPDDPLFPATLIAVSDNGLFEATGLRRKHWKNATAIRRIFRQAFEGAGLPYYNPHSFRNTLVAFGQKICKTPEMLKAWSQNLAHADVLTTLTSYGVVASNRQAEIFESLRFPGARRKLLDDEPDKETIQRVFDHLMAKVY
jgi:integrase